MYSCRPFFLTPVLCAAALALLLVSSARGAVTAAECATPQQVLSRAEERLHGLTDYCCFAEGQAVAGNKSEGGSYRVWYRNAGLLRVKVVSGRQRGCEITCDAKGQVRARKGGLLKPFVVRLRPDDRRLMSIRGIPITEISWDSFYRRWRQTASAPGTRATLTSRMDQDAPYEVVLAFEKDGKQLREYYRIDPKLWVLVEAEMWEDDRRVDYIRFQEIQLDTGLEAKFFRL